MRERPFLSPARAGVHRHYTSDSRYRGTAGEGRLEAAIASKARRAVSADLSRARHLTVYHPTSTCGIGGVVDPRLRVNGVGRLRVADASVMPAVIGGNTNAPAIMIGEKAAEIIAAEHGVQLAEFVGERV